MIPGSGRPVPIPLTPQVISGIDAVVRLRAQSRAIPHWAGLRLMNC